MPPRGLRPDPPATSCEGHIPVQNLDFWQGMMLWNIIQPILFGGRRGGGRTARVESGRRARVERVVGDPG